MQKAEFLDKTEKKVVVGAGTTLLGAGVAAAGTIGGLKVGAIIGGAVGSIGGPAGTIAGAVAGGALGFAVGGATGGIITYFTLRQLDKVHGKKIEKLFQEVSRLNESKAVAETRIKDLEERNVILDRKNAQLMQEIAELKQRASETETESIRRLGKEKEELEAAKQRLERELSETKAKLQKAEDEIVILRTELQATRATLEVVQVDLAENKAETQRQKQDFQQQLTEQQQSTEDRFRAQDAEFAAIRAELMQRRHTQDEVRTRLACPITHDMMVDPVTLPTGQTYEREQIVQWYTTTKKQNGEWVCPLTRKLLKCDPSKLPTNYAIKNLSELSQREESSQPSGLSQLGLFAPQSRLADIGADQSQAPAAHS